MAGPARDQSRRAIAFRAALPCLALIASTGTMAQAQTKMNRYVWVTGTLRRDWLDSNIPGNSTNATIVMLGVRLQN